MQLLQKTTIWFLFGATFVFLFSYFLIREPLTWGGDIAEYYGTSESLINHASPDLNRQDQKKLEEVLNPEYFDMKGYYIEGINGKRYPVHFIFYSILLIPFRIVLQIVGQPQIKTLVFTNIAILAGTLLFFLKKSTFNSFQKLVLLIAVFLSPFIYFLFWPGPDMFYLCAMLFSIYFFSQKRYLASALSSALASWHSQPLLIFSLGMLALYGLHILKLQYSHHAKKLEFHLSHIKIKHIMYTGVVLGILFIPYMYNLLAFGVLSPWQILEDFWTEYYGFGFHNASIQKFFEQFFDLNIGLFWYIPILFIVGCYAIVKKALRSVEYVWLIFVTLVTALAYQTNPAWHYGTAGYGPTRHAIFILPILLYYFVTLIKPKLKHYAILTALVLTQLFVLYFNKGITPNLLDVLHHNPYSSYVLNHYPSIYNPTPEIFVDRTNHTDKDYPTSAFYKHNDICTKAYVLLHEKAKAEAECGYIPAAYLEAFDQPKELQDIDIMRSIKTTQALFLPRSYGCDETFIPEYGQEYVCMRTIEDVISYTGITDPSRLRPIEGLEGGWEFTWGPPQEIQIPQGYGVEYYSFDGIYITY